VPDVVAQVIPIFFFFIVLEGLICQFRWSKGRFRFNDSLASMSHATCLRVFELIGEVAIEYHMYILAYEKFHFFEMKPESRTTWILALLGADLSYYWAHRAMHEVNLMWSAHQVHHRKGSHF
jgi:alkylglycerol monooxygenase